MNFHTVRARLILIAVMVAISLAILGGLSVAGMKNTSKSLELIYSRDMLVSNKINEVINLLADARSELLLAFQHDPAGQFAAMHDHPVAEHLDHITANLEQSLTIINQAILGADLSPRNRAVAESLLTKFKQIKQQGFAISINHINNENYRRANLTLLQVINPQFMQVNRIANDFLAIKLSMVEQEFIATNEGVAVLVIEIVLLILGLAAIICAVIVLISKRVNMALARIQSVADEIVEGNLTKQVNLAGQDEFSHLSYDVDKIVQSFQSVIAAMNEQSIQISSSAEESSAVAVQGKQGLVEQQHQTQTIATSINQLTSTVQEVANSAASAADASKEATSASSQGRTLVLDTISQIVDLNNEITDTTKLISQLSDKSNQIGSVVDVIDGISEQTNLLALNAAIEAARAGEAGRGFAVVADEVRSLATRTQESTVEIKAMIAALQESSHDSLLRMEKGAESAQSTVDMAEKAGTALNDIATSVNKILELNTQIATAAEQQSMVTNEINKNVICINDISLQTAGAAEQSSVAASELAALTEAMKERVSQFKFA